MTQYTFHQDPGHGWLEVPRSEIIRLGIAKEITAYSYQRGERVFLEEDCDAPRFLRAKKEAGEPIPETVKVYNDDAPCRNYADYQP